MGISKFLTTIIHKGDKPRYVNDMVSDEQLQEKYVESLARKLATPEDHELTVRERDTWNLLESAIDGKAYLESRVQYYKTLKNLKLTPDTLDDLACLVVHVDLFDLSTEALEQLHLIWTNPCIREEFSTMIKFYVQDEAGLEVDLLARVIQGINDRLTTSHLRTVVEKAKQEVREKKDDWALR